MSRKRLRPSLSCNYCKRRKVKCDRGKPCSSCVRYNVANLCEYSEGWEPAGAENGVFQIHNQRPPPSTSADHRNVTNKSAVASELDVLKDRIRQLENSIKAVPSPESIYSPEQNAPIDRNGISPGFPPPLTPLVPGCCIEQLNANRHIPLGSRIDATNGTQTNPVGLGWSHQRVQLPPLNWSRTPSTTEDYHSSTASESKSTMHPSVTNYALNSPEDFVGVNPYASENDMINLNKGYTSVHIKRSSRHLNFGPFSWLSILKKDKVLLSVWTFLQDYKADVYTSQGKTMLECGTFKFNTSKNDLPVVTPAEQEQQPTEVDTPGNFKIFKAAPETDSKFQSIALVRDGVEDLRPYDEMNKDKLEQRRTINKLSNDKSSGVSFYEGKIDQELALIDRIKVILPKQKVCWMLINRFFELVYPYAPFVDEANFRQEMTRIIGPEGFLDAPISEVQVQNRLDLPRMGTLLVMLRLTYLSLFSNRNGVNEYNMNSDDPSPEVQQIKYLLKNPVNIDVIDITEECLSQFDTSRKSNPIIIQCAFLLRIYRTFSPEDGDGTDGGDSQITNGVLIQMAQSCGLNREPDYFEDYPVDAKSRHLGRKIWFFLIVMDLNLSLNYGSPPAINEKCYDTRLPYYKAGNENSFDVDKEKHMLSSLAYFEKYYPTLRRVLDMCLDMNNDARVKDITHELSVFEGILKDNYGVLQDYLVPFKEDKFAYPFLKTMKCKNYLNLKRFIMNLTYHLFLYYEAKENNELSYFYLRKVLAGFLGEMVPGYFQLVANNHLNFGEVSDLILNPPIQMTIQRSNQMVIAVMCRVNRTIYLMKNSEKHDEYLEWNTDNYRTRFAKLCKLSKQLQKIVEYTTALLSRLANRYYFAWKISKAHNFLVKVMTGKSFYRATKDILAPVFEMTEEQIDCFSTICDKALRNFSKTKITRFARDIYDEISKDSNLNFMNPSERNTELVSDHSTDRTSLEPSSIGDNSDFQFIFDADVDKIWSQLASMKDSFGPLTEGQPIDEHYLDLEMLGDTSTTNFAALPFSFDNPHF